MIVLHVAPVNSADYFERRLGRLDPDLPNAEYGKTYREAHVNRCLAMPDVVVAAGPSTDGKCADVFYRVASREQLDRLLEGDPYVYGNVWVEYPVRAFLRFVEPRGRVPVCLDGSRQVIAVEGDVVDAERVMATLDSLQARDRLVCGGVLERDRGLAWVRASDAEEAARWLTENGGWGSDGLVSRSMVWVI